MRHEDLRAETKRAAEMTPRRLETRLTSGEKRNRKRMAQVATVYTLAPWVRKAADILHTLRPDNLDALRPRPSHKRVWASVEHNPQQVVDDAFAEATRPQPAATRATSAQAGQVIDIAPVDHCRNGAAPFPWLVELLDQSDRRAIEMDAFAHEQRTPTGPT